MIATHTNATQTPLSRQVLCGLLLCCFGWSGWSAPVYASDLQVSPIRLDFAPDTRVQALRLGNPGAAALVVQVELFRWTQDTSSDQLEASRDFIATPPITEIPAHDRRVIRIGPRQQTDKTATQACETAYRVVITEIPTQGGSTAPVQFRAQVSLPLFLRAASQCQPKLQWKRSGEQLEIRNSGDGHDLITALALDDGSGPTDIALPGLAYLLPGTQRQFAIPSGLSSGAMTLTMQTRSGQYRGPLPAAQ